MKTMTVQLLWPSGLVVTLPEGAPVPRAGELYEHRIWEDPRQEGSRWRTRARLGLGGAVAARGRHGAVPGRPGPLRPQRVDGPGEF